MTNSKDDKKIKYLYTIKSVRETNKCTDDLIDMDKLNNFDVNLDQFPEIVDFVIGTVRESFPRNEDLLTIPVHGRYQHFETNGIKRLTNLINNEFKDLTGLEICKKLIDLFIVSVLLDAGAGNVWKYKEESSGLNIDRSEGIAVASFYMFINGKFSSNSNDKYTVNGDKLSELTSKDLIEGFQISNTNPIAGFDGRLKLLNKLGETLKNNREIFGEDSRPGNLVDYLISKKCTQTSNGYKLELEDLWDSLMQGLSPIWPTEGRIKVNGETIGDAWFLQNKISYSLKEFNVTNPDELPEWSKIVTFHKLTQWLTYSLFLPLTKYGKFDILNTKFMTGLPEYRNGGLFLDFKLLNLKSEILEKGLKFSKKVGFNELIPTYEPSDDVIVEWRSCTICLLDKLLPLVNEKMKIKGTKYEISLPQLIEAGSWKSGRLIAKKLRDNGGPPIELFADGTVF